MSRLVQFLQRWTPLRGFKKTRKCAAYMLLAYFIYVLQMLILTRTQLYQSPSKPCGQISRENLKNTSDIGIPECEIMQPNDSQPIKSEPQDKGQSLEGNSSIQLQSQHHSGTKLQQQKGDTGVVEGSLGEQQKSPIDIDAILKHADSIGYSPQKMYEKFAFPCSAQLFRDSAESSTSDPVHTDISFIETACHTWLVSHQSCAIESACKHNPDAKVTLKTLSTSLSADDPYLMLLKQIPNFQLHFINPWKRVQNTSLEKWLSQEKWKIESKKSESKPFGISDLSNAFRYLELYLEGGIYMDLDIITLKSLEPLRRTNALGIEAAEYMANGAFLSVQLKKAEFIRSALKRYEDPNWRGNDPEWWGMNGPGAITELIKKSNCKELLKKGGFCKNANMTILPVNAIYPLHYSEAEKIYDPKHREYGLQKIKDSYAFHLWNSIRGSKKPEIGKNALIDAIAKEHCPYTYSIVSKYGIFY